MSEEGTSSGADHGAAVSESGAEAIVKSGSSADLTSFDDLERVTAPPPKESKKASPKKEQSAELKVQGSKEHDGESKKPETKEAAKESAKDGKDTKESKESKAAKELTEQAAKAQLKTAPKMFKTKVGDQDVELPSDAKFPVKIDGKMEEVTLEEAINSYSGKNAIGKRMQQLDTERKAFYSERDELNHAVNKLSELGSKDPKSAIEYLCEILEENPAVFFDRLEKQIEPVLEEYASLSPEEREARKTQRRLSYYESQAERQKADRAREAEKASAANRIQAVKQKYNLDDEVYAKTSKELDLLKLTGEYDGEITPEIVGQVHRSLSGTAALKEIFNSPELSGVDDKEGKMAYARKMFEQDQDLSIAELKAAVLQAFGSEAAQKLSRKVKRSNPDTEARTVAVRGMNRKEAVTFEDLDELG